MGFKKILTNVIFFNQEAILIDEKGLITEGAASAFFAFFGQKLRTAPPEANILPSITSIFVKKASKNLGLEIIEKSMTLPEATAADELFIAVTTKDIVGARLCLCGNIDCGLLLLGGPEAVYDATRDLLNTCKDGGNLVVGASNAVQPEAPIENGGSVMSSVMAPERSADESNVSIRWLIVRPDHSPLLFAMLR